MAFAWASKSRASRDGLDLDKFRTLAMLAPAPRPSRAYSSPLTRSKVMFDVAMLFFEIDYREGTAMKITVERTIAAQIERVWSAWNTPEDIEQWNAASDDWHTTKSIVDTCIDDVHVSKGNKRIKTDPSEVSKIPEEFMSRILITGSADGLGRAAAQTFARSVTTEARGRSGPPRARGASGSRRPLELRTDPKRC
jgi:uncharacterized protein YndB with AHSA1/START domain